MSEEEDIISAPHYSSWIMFARLSLNNNNYPRVIELISL